jgi:flavin-dependent dehydrogenase
VTFEPVGGVDALCAPRRTVLDPILVDAARSAGAVVRFRARVTDVLWDRRGEVAGVSGRGPDGEPFTVRAGLTIGADGMGSLVARLAGAPIERRGPGAGAVVYSHVAGVAGDGYEWRYGDGVTAGVIPTNDGLACVFAGTSRRRFRSGPELDRDLAGAYQHLLGEVAPDLARQVAAAPREGPLRSFPGASGFLRRPVGPGWALVGDAGYFRDPLGAHGISDALRDAELLARAVVTGRLEGGRAALSAALDHYHRTRDELVVPHFEATQELATYRWDTSTVEALVRRVSASTAHEIAHLTGLSDVPLRATT